MSICVRLITRGLLGPVCTLFILLFPLFSNAGSYSDSAHGDTDYGVLRTGVPPVYARGNCGHCHAQHLPGNGGLLFEANFTGQRLNPYSSADNVCFQCHQANGAVQLEGGIRNENYSATFGGASALTSGILEAFNQNSYHNLYDLQRYISGSLGTKAFPTFPSWANPCSGCHNAHLVKANKRSIGDPRETVMSKPSDHETLWGDGTGTAEVMTVYGDGYQPPLYRGSATLLEPDGIGAVAIIQAGKTPNYNGFCTDCHNSTNLIYSTELGRNLRTFAWSSEAHGEGVANNQNNRPEMRAPYFDYKLGGYVLSCLDCHEPHGSSNVYLIRPSVNGGDVFLPPVSQDWDRLCSRCHAELAELKELHHRAYDINGQTFGTQCEACHAVPPAHGVAGEMQPCVNCHFHGSSGDGLQTF